MLLELPEWLQEKIEPEPNTSCWLWIAGLSKSGYGKVQERNSRKTYRAHRYVFGLVKGQFKGQLDHRCCQKSCVNPDHLEIVTQKENMARHFQKQTHCRRGHPLSGFNLIFRNKGHQGQRWRACRICTYRVNNDYNRKKRTWLRAVLPQ